MRRSTQGMMSELLTSSLKLERIAKEANVYQRKQPSKGTAIIYDHAIYDFGSQICIWLTEIKLSYHTPHPKTWASKNISCLRGAAAISVCRQGGAHLGAHRTPVVDGLHLDSNQHLHAKGSVL